MDQRVDKGQMALRGKRVKWDQRAQEDLQAKQETKDQRETVACQDPEDQQGRQESKGKMVQEVMLVMLDQEETLVSLDRRETLEGLALAILEQGGKLAREEKRAILDLVAAEETVDKRASQEIKEVQENQVSQGPRVNLDQEDGEESLAVTAILAQREIQVSLNVTS